MLKITVLSLFILLIIKPVEAQKRDLIALADKTFQIGEYYKAIDKYKKAYSKEKDKVKKTEIIYKMAHCYRMTNEVKKAKAKYKSVIKRKYTDPKVYLYYGQMLKKDGELKEAKDAFATYLQEVPGDSLAQRALSGCDSVLTWTNNPTRYQIANIKDFNSRENDFAPIFVSDDYRELYFTSSREGSEGNKVHGATGENFTDIFFTRLDNKQKWSVPVPLDKAISSMYDDGTPWVSSDGSRMYFTRCRFDKVEELGCQIMLSTNSSGNIWVEPTVVPIAHDSVVIAHPSLTEDELNMYFVSNLYGGYGGKDLWKISRASIGDTWGLPDNLGPEINTAGDEMFPYVKSDSLIYFSSNGHIGMGGLDIFKATLNIDGVWEIENMRFPINSEADDFGIVFHKADEQGYFTSSRKEGARGGDDIYSFLLPSKKFSIAGVVLNKKDDMPVDSANVKLIGSEGTNLEYTTDSTGRFSFILKPETDYILVSVKDKFLNGKVRETTVGIPDSRDFEVSLIMDPIEKPVELPNILYDLARWSLRPESEVALDVLVETLEDNPNITIELMSHTDIRPFTTMTNQELSQKRAQSVVNYLIIRGIDKDRLEAKGYGPEVPRVGDENMAEQHEFIAIGDTLNKEFIDSLDNADFEEIAHQFNRRTEFRVLSTDFVPKKQKEKGMSVDQQIIEMGRRELEMKNVTDSISNARHESRRNKAVEVKKTGKTGGGGKLL